MRKITPIAAAIATLAAGPALASFDVDLPNGDKISFGGYLKLDARYVDGDVAYQDYWLGNIPSGSPVDTSHFGMNVRESRLNFKYVHGDVTGFVEMDFYGGDGNEVVSNSSNPRLRHAFIKYNGWLVGQYWSNFMSTAALPEALDFAGPMVGEVFIRQPQIRYTMGGLSLAIENPETWGDGDVGASSSAVGVSGTNADPDEKMPDLTAAYTVKGDWGQVMAAVLVRQIEDDNFAGSGQSVDETAVAYSLAGKINTFGKDDFRFQVIGGEPGRYVGGTLPGADVVLDQGRYELEETTAYSLGYRHFWSDLWRSTVYYGKGETDIREAERSHWGLNLIRQITPQLSAGVEVGNYSVDDANLASSMDSDYYQFSMKFDL